MIEHDELIAAAEAAACRSVEDLAKDAPARSAFSEYLEAHGVSWALDWRQLDAGHVAETVWAGIRTVLSDATDQPALARLEALLARRAGQMILDL